MGWEGAHPLHHGRALPRGTRATGCSRAPAALSPGRLARCSGACHGSASRLPRPALCAYDCLCGSGEGWAPLPSLLALAHTLLHAHTRVRARARSQWAAALHNASPFTPSLAIPAPRDRTGRERAHNFSPSPPPRYACRFLALFLKLGRTYKLRSYRLPKKYARPPCAHTGPFIRVGESFETCKRVDTRPVRKIKP